MIITNLVRAMIASGCTPEQILAAVEAAETEMTHKLEQRRHADAERKRRQRSTQSTMSRDGVGHHVTSRDPSSLPPTPPNPTPQKKTPPMGGQKKGPKGNHPLREDWALGPDLLEYARKYGLTSGEAEEVAEAMRTWAGSKGITRKSWYKTYQTFVQREAKDRKVHHGKATNRSSLIDLYDELNEEIAGYERAEREGRDQSSDSGNDGVIEDEGGGRKDASSVIPLRMSGSGD